MATQLADLTAEQRITRTIAVLLSKAPSRLLRALGGTPTNRAGNVMAPDIALLMKATAAGPDYSDHGPEQAREMVDTDSATFADVLPALNLVEELDLPGGLSATRYRPTANSTGLILYFHGGGFVVGNRESYDAPARFLAVHTGLDVLSVEYRLAPEFPFPAQNDDALTAWDYAVRQAPEWNIDPHLIVVAGDSAGGTIAAVLAQRLRGNDIQPAAQALLYPATDFSTKRPSHAEFADSPALSAKQIDWFLEHYIPACTDRTDPRLSPLCADDLSGLPPAVVLTAGFDPLRDEGDAYANRLAAQGVLTKLLREDGQVHGFISFTAVSKTSAEATKRFAAAVVEALKSVPVQ